MILTVSFLTTVNSGQSRSRQKAGRSCRKLVGSLAFILPWLKLKWHKSNIYICQKCGNICTINPPLTKMHGSQHLDMILFHSSIYDCNSNVLWYIAINYHYTKHQLIGKSDPKSQYCFLYVLCYLDYWLCNLAIFFCRSSLFYEFF